MTSRKRIKYYIPGALALVLGIVAFCMMFVAAAKYEGIGSGALEMLGFGTSLTGAQIAFGYAEGDVQVLNFNILTTLGFFLPLIGGLLALLFKNGLITKIVTTGCFVAGAVLLFTTVASLNVGFLSSESEGFNSVLENFYEYLKEEFVLGAGAIAGGVISAVGAAVCLFKGTLAKVFDR